MKLADKVLGVPDKLAVPENPHYGAYRSGVYRAETGLSVAIGGVAAGSAGLEVAWIPLLAGAAITYWGAIKIVAGLAELNT